VEVQKPLHALIYLTERQYATYQYALNKPRKKRKRPSVQRHREILQDALHFLVCFNATPATANRLGCHRVELWLEGNRDLEDIK
jgi:hypothetical protein